MPYCVQCGVELNAGTPKCPLCDTSVLLPDSCTQKAAEPAFSEKVVLPKSARKRFTAYMVSMVMLIPNIVCILTNLLFDQGARWSFHIAATSALLWTLFVFPFFVRKFRPYIAWALDSAAVGAYIYFLFNIGNSERWYTRCALPAICAASLFALIYILWFRAKPRSKTSRAIHLLADILLCLLFIGVQISYYYKSRTPIYVCLIVDASLFAVLLFLIYCEKSRRMKAWLTRNFFVE